MSALDYEFGDFWDSADREHNEGGCYSRGGYTSSFTYDPLYYHKKFEFVSIFKETEKAYLFSKDDGTGFWVPKAMCKKLKFKKKTVSVYIHQSFIFSKVKITPVHN